MEYRRAKSRRIPLHILVSSEQHSFTEKEIEKAPENLAKLEAELTESHVVSVLRFARV